MRLSLPISVAHLGLRGAFGALRPKPRQLTQASAALVAVCGALACTPQQVFIEKPCPPVEYPVVKAPVTAPPSDEAVPRTLEIKLSPARNDGGNVIAVDVTMRFSVPPVDFGNADPIVLHLDPHVAGAATGDRIDDLAAHDSEGSLGLKRVTEGAQDKLTRAEWRAERRARGPVTLNYRVQLLAEDAARDEVISSAGGVLGVGRALFLMPSTTESYAIRVEWELQSLGPDAHGNSSFGGDASEVDGQPSILENAVWIAGSLEEMTMRSAGTSGSSSSRFRMISLGKTAFDVTEVGPWANRVWLAIRPVSAHAPDFDLFVHSAGKTGKRLELGVFGHSAIAKSENDVKFAWPEKLRLTEAFLRGARGTNVMNQRWFDEGFGTYIALDALRKTGLANPADIGAEIAKRAERYFASRWWHTHIINLMSAREPDAVDQVEDRGLLFAAELDAKIRAASAGKRSFVDFIRSLEPAPPANTDTTDTPKATGINVAAFTKALEKELGADAVTRYQAVVEFPSAQTNLPDDAFGPCFKKVKKKIQREPAEPGSKKRESVDGFTFAVVPKLPPSCANVVTPQVGGLQKTP